MGGQKAKRNITVEKYNLEVSEENQDYIKNWAQGIMLWSGQVSLDETEPNSNELICLVEEI